jgi:hypothetical protein
MRRVLKKFAIPRDLKYAGHPVIYPVVVFPHPLRLANGFTFMFTLISYLWILFTLTVLIAPLVVGLMSRPKRTKPAVANAAAGEPTDAATEEAPAEEPVLDFNDELAEMKPN